MKNKDKYYVLLFFCIFLLSGCVVRTYQLTKERVDQDLTSGNRGYIQGKVPVEEPAIRPQSRTTQVVELELHPPLKFEKAPKAAAPAAPRTEVETKEAMGNQGYITQSIAPEIAQPPEAPAMEKYVVQKGDTLQKISQKFYGTTRKWKKIFEANKNTLKSPDRVYPGKTINIPQEPLQEPQQNLK